jgi:VWFA-related protein
MIPRARQIRLAPLLATLLAALVLFGQSGAARRSATFDPQTPQNPTFRSGAYFVRVDAYPRKDGRIVDGLTRDDFEILEDGKPQKVETSEFFRIDTNQLQAFRRDPASIEESNAAVADPANRVFVIYLDTYHVSVEGSHAARQPLITMLDRLLMPNDLFGVITPEMRARDLTFARKTNTIADMLTRDWAWGQRDSGQRDPDEEALHNCFAVNPSTGSGSPWMVEDDGLRRELSNVLIDRRREDITLSKLEELVNYLAKIREERKSLIVFTTGWRLFREDLALAAQAQPGIPLRCNGELTRLAAIDDQQRMRDVIAASNRGNVTFYPVNPQGLIAFDSPINEHVEPSQSALAAGGGSPLVADQNRLRARTDALMTLASNTDGIATASLRICPRTTCSATTRAMRSSMGSIASSKSE